MRKVEEKIERYDTYIHFEAIDGTIFESEEECRKYENSAIGVLSGKVQKFIASEKKDAWDLMGGCDDNKIVAFRMKEDHEVDTFLQWFYLQDSWLLKDEWKERREMIEKIVREAAAKEDVVLMGLNCGDEYYFINSRQNIIDNLKNMTNK